MVRTNALDDQALLSEICFSDQIDVALVSYFGNAESLHQQTAGLARHVNRKVKQSNSSCSHELRARHLLCGDAQDLLDLTVPITPLVITWQLAILVRDFLFVHQGRQLAIVRKDQ